MKNILGTDLKLCSKEPLTGFYRDRFCRTEKNDEGYLILACTMTNEFFDFTKSKGNDLPSPNILFNFPELKKNDKWCACAIRWKEAHSTEFAPPVILESTPEKALKIIDVKTLFEMSVPSRIMN